MGKTKNRREELKRAWQSFKQRGSADGEVRQEVFESWERCRQLNQTDFHNDKKRWPPADDEKVQKILNQNEILISTAALLLSRIAEMVSDSQYVISLHDRHCYMIDRYFAGNSLVFPQGSFQIGEKWDEAHFGTNAPHLCMKYDKPFLLDGAEHYYEIFHHLSCVAVPIHSEEGEIIGCVSMIGSYSENTSHTLGLVSAVAYLIETQLKLTKTVQTAAASFDTVAEGWVVLNADYTVRRVSPYTGHMLNVKKEELRNLNFAGMFAYEDFKKRLEDGEASFSYPEYDLDIDGRKVRCNVTVAPVKIMNRFVGVVLILREIKDVIRLANKVMGNRSYYCFSDIITEDKEIMAQIKTMKSIAATDCSVLIEGESGVGKELFAHSIHSASRRLSGPFIVVNCASIPQNLVESELFGYEKGAFTGASSNGSPGKFELADGGTIFLDEIGELPLEIQAKLLRVLDNHRVRRIGAKTEHPLDIRVIAATNRHLWDEVEKKNFRGDLYFRINVVKFNIPPLRERRGDVLLLADYFLSNISRKEENIYKQFTEGFRQMIQEYSWPGNVRELQNAVARAFYASRTSLIEAEDLPQEVVSRVLEIRGNGDKASGQGETERPGAKSGTAYGSENEKEEKPAHCNANYAQTKMQFECESILAAIRMNNGNVTAAGMSLGMSKSTIYRKIKKYGIRLN